MLTLCAHEFRQGFCCKFAYNLHLYSGYLLYNRLPISQSTKWESAFIFCNLNGRFYVGFAIETKFFSFYLPKLDYFNISNKHFLHVTI